MVSRLVLVAFFAIFTTAPGARAQAGQGMFLTPVPDAPFVGQVSTQRAILRPNGTPIMLHRTGMIARDADGRIRNQMTAFMPQNSTATAPVVVMHLYDPQNRLSTRLYPISRRFRILPIRHPPATDAPAGCASPAGSRLPPSPYTNEQDLRTRTIAGQEVHDVRETQKIPAAASGTGKEIVVTDEYWYSYDLNMNLSVTRTDPRTGSVTMTVTQLTRTDPDPSLFTIRAGYMPFGVPSPPAHKAASN